MIYKSIKTFVISNISLCLIFGQISVSASVDVKRISKSETFGFKITALNVDDSPSVDISSLSPQFKVISGPSQQTNKQWVKGSMTSSRTLSWTLSLIHI